ncbi:MAG: HAMP domain-containing sensor histidine kinase [Candidatus Dormiibacterota bacterium]
MRRNWRSTEIAEAVPATDVASEIFWRSLAGVAVFDQSGRLAYSNPAFRETPGLSSLVDGRGYLSSPALEAARRDAVRRGGRRGMRCATAEADLPLEVEVVPLNVAPEWTALTIRDATIESDFASDSLILPMLIHELRGPLLLAQESLEELTQLSAGSQPDLQDAVARQGRSLARLTGLVQGLADLSRARDLGRTRQSWTAVDLGQQVADVAEIYRDLAAARGLDLVVTIEPNVPAIEGHADLLGRAIANLVDNALKYGDVPGSIRLSLIQRGALVVVEVADGGPGIEPCDQFEIFTEFNRLPQARASRIPGTGLGLSVARRVVEAHGGRLSLESHVGVGSVFRLSLLAGRGAGVGMGSQSVSTAHLEPVRRASVRPN